MHIGRHPLGIQPRQIAQQPSQNARPGRRNRMPQTNAGAVDIPVILVRQPPLPQHRQNSDGKGLIQLNSMSKVMDRPANGNDHGHDLGAKLPAYRAATDRRLRSTR